MMDMDKAALMDEAVAVYGLPNRCVLTMEECGELIQAVSKICRAYNGDIASIPPALLENLAEEIADVSLMCEQLTRALNIVELGVAYERFKCERLHVRLAASKADAAPAS